MTKNLFSFYPETMTNSNRLKTGAVWVIHILLLVALLPSARAQAMPDKWSVSLGVGFNQYKGQVKRIIDRYNKNTPYGHAALHIELPGAYWIQNNQHWLIGGGFATDLDTFSVTHADFYFLKFHAYLSNLYFINHTNQQGVYIRGDIGVMREMVAGDPVFSPEYYWGLTSTIALGYAKPITKGSRLMLQFYFMPQLSNHQYESNSGFTIGILF